MNGSPSEVKRLEDRIRNLETNANGASASIQNAMNGSPSEVKRLEDQIHYLETKVNAYLAYTSDPFLSGKLPAVCKEERNIMDIGCVNKTKCEVDNASICLDNLPFIPGDDNNRKENCVVYDYGIRKSPEFGLAFAAQCNVVGFDPSPISIEWWKTEKDKILKEYPYYNFSPVGAGGVDGPLLLREYSWDQVSIIEFPYRTVDTTNCDEGGACKYKFHEQQKTFSIPVSTLKTAMSEHGHSRISLLKLDVEGSEYTFLEKMIDDLSCRKVDQLVLEWHHYDYDLRYGVTSNPQRNVLVALLKDRCGLEQFWVHSNQGWPANDKIYVEMGMTLYYTLSSFIRTKEY